MKITNLKSPLVSVDFLQENIEASNLIVLDATINKVINATSIRIPTARFFDIKKRFSDTSAPFPSTLPSAEQFQAEAKNLGISQNSCIVVYDDKGIYSSARVWWLFKTFRFHNVAVLDGGLPEWKQNNFIVENYKDEIYVKGDFEAHFNSKLMTDFEGVNQFSKQGDTLVIDARSKARFKCLVDEPRAGLRRGTIPNSKNLSYTSLIEGNTLKPVDELSVIFSNLVEEKENLLFSCGSGITACVLVLAATLCNYNNLIVYDGSWTEYGSLTD